MSQNLVLPEGYRAWYQHERFYTEASSGIVHDPRGGETYCYVVPDRKGAHIGEAIAIGRAVCNDRDNYNKAIGRQIALGRALKKLKENS